MSDLFSIIAPVFALIVLGRAAVYFRLLDAPGLRGVNDFVFFLALPCLLFRSIVKAPRFDVLDIAASYFAGCLLIYVAAMVLARLLLGARLSNAAMIGLNASYGNTVMMGIPIVAALFGTPALWYLLGIVSLQSAIMLPLTTILVEAGQHGFTGFRPIARATVKGLVRNPVIVSIAIAIIWRLLSVPVPAAFDQLLAMLGAAGPPLALFCLGASLPPVRLSGMIGEPLLSSVLKLVCLPAVVWAVSRASGMTGQALAVAVLTAGMPTGANAFLLARRAGALIEASASTSSSRRRCRS